MPSRPALATHKDLRVWQLSLDLAVKVHALVRELPPFERRSIGDQAFRAANSIPANIAEGFARPHGAGEFRDYRRFIGIARGSCAELDTHLELIGRMMVADQTRLAELRETADHVMRMLTLLHRRLGAAG